MKRSSYYAHDWLTTFRAGLSRAKWPCSPYLCPPLDVTSGSGWKKSGWVKKTEETAMLMADAVIAVSQLTKRHMWIEEYSIRLTNSRGAQSLEHLPRPG